MDEQQQNEQELTKIIEYHYAEIRRLRGELDDAIGRTGVVVARVRRLEDLLVGLSETGTRSILNEPLAAIAQRYGVQAAERLGAIIEEVRAIRAERQG